MPARTSLHAFLNAGLCIRECVARACEHAFACAGVCMSECRLTQLLLAAHVDCEPLVELQQPVYTRV